MASMGSKGDAFDNAAAESFMATIKTELIYRNTFRKKDDARLAVFRYIEGFYNQLRRHSALDYKSPMEYEKMLMATEETVVVAAEEGTLRLTQRYERKVSTHARKTLRPPVQARRSQART